MGVNEQGPRYRDPLALPAGEADAALPDHGLVAVREPPDKAVRLRVLCGCPDLLVRGVGSSEGDVVADGAGEEAGFLQDHPDLGP